MGRLPTDSGCVTISFGYESGSQRVLDLIDKGVAIARRGASELEDLRLLSAFAQHAARIAALRDEAGWSVGREAGLDLECTALMTSLSRRLIHADPLLRNVTVRLFDTLDDLVSLSGRMGR